MLGEALGASVTGSVTGSIASSITCVITGSTTGCVAGSVAGALFQVIGHSAFDGMSLGGTSSGPSGNQPGKMVDALETLGPLLTADDTSRRFVFLQTIIEVPIILLSTFVLPNLPYFPPQPFHPPFEKLRPQRLRISAPRS